VAENRLAFQGAIDKGYPIVVQWLCELGRVAQLVEDGSNGLYRGRSLERATKCLTVAGAKPVSPQQAKLCMREAEGWHKENTMDSYVYRLGYQHGFEDGQDYACRWIPCTERLPDTDREVFAWAKGCGIYYTARYSSVYCPNQWNVPWEITHWMERPNVPHSTTEPRQGEHQWEQ